MNSEAGRRVTPSHMDSSSRAIPTVCLESGDSQPWTYIAITRGPLKMLVPWRAHPRNPRLVHLGFGYRIRILKVLPRDSGI